MAICSICKQPCGLVSAHPQCESEVAAGKTPERIRYENEWRAGQTSRGLVRSSAKALKTCAAIFAPVIVIAFAIAGANEGRDEVAVLLLLVGGGVGVLTAALLYNFCVLIGAAALRMSEYIDKAEKAGK